GSSFGTTVSIDAPTTLGTFDFLSGAPTYTFNVNANLALLHRGFVYEGGGAAASVNLGAGTTLTLAGPDPGSITGSGGLDVYGDGAVLTGHNTYTGGTHVDSQSVLTGTTDGLQGPILLDPSNIGRGLLIFSQAFDGVYGGTISGGGVVRF